MATQEKVDVVVIGAGPAGSIFADVLARAGRKVVVLEFGPDWQNEELISSEIWARRIKHAPRFQATGRHNPRHGYNAGWGTGGSMLHWSSNFPRLHPSDFSVRSRYGKGFDWPISYDELSPYYDRIAEQIGVSGDAAAERRWYPIAKNHPMPPMKTFRHSEIFVDAYKKFGIPLAPMPTAINSTEYKDRPACVYDGWCHAGCPIGAQATPQFTHLKDARANGAELRPFSYVTRVLTNPTGDCVTGVEYYDGRKEQHVQPAAAVVIAAYSAETPRMLLNSKTDKHPNGLANRNGLVGKYLMCNPVSTVWAMFDEDVQNHMGSMAFEFMSYEHYDKQRLKGFGSTFIRVGAAMKPNFNIAGARPDLFGQPLVDFMKQAVRGLTRVNYAGEEMPRSENRVELSSDKDEFGLPIARMTHEYPEETLENWSFARNEAFEVVKAVNPKEAWKAGTQPSSSHLMGGTIMGRSAGDSVTNSFGQTHELANLYLAGGGLFPTTGAVNPTNTLMAVSLRGAEHMADNFATIAR